MQADLEKVRQHIRIVGDLTKLAGSARDLEAFLDQAVVQIARAVEIDHAKILRYRPEMGDFIVQAGIGWKPGVVRTATLPADLDSGPGRAFQTGEAVVVEDFERQTEYTLSPFLKQHGIVALANAPLPIGNVAWGVVEVDSTGPRSFGHDTSEFLIVAGATIGNCIHRLGMEPQSERLATAVLEAQHRETLLREMQHRVKNSFQLVLAAIAQQKRRYQQDGIGEALNNIAERIRAISLAHDQLEQRDTGQVVKLSDYLRALCHSLKQQIENIEIDVEVDEVELAIDRAVALGLILNETAINSVKHAFGESGGRITVKLESGIGYGEARLTVTDDGSGMPQEAPNPGSGLRLISALARKIGGKVKRTSSERGTSVTVQFPVIP
jgi:two-component sensor histidine kinase